ncbi:MAG: sugar phosphate isomerase/epimerase [Anaerolineales bacterium]|nr:sugar phosphate isomerase/epimerase [Anaerolineales bacterium]
MQFGSSTMFLRDKPVTVALELIARSGFVAAEVWIEHLWRSDETPETIKQRARDLGLTLTVHATSYDINICSTNPGIRRESLRQMEESLEIAACLDARVVAMHPGFLSSSRASLETAWAALLETVAALDAKAARYGLRLGVEAMEKRSKEFFVLPPDLLRLFQRAYQATGLTIDLAHAQTVMEPRDYLAQIPAERIVHAHCSDNAPRQTHLPLGRGSFDLSAALDALGEKYDGIVILEGYVPGQGEKIVPANAEYLRARAWIK